MARPNRSADRIVDALIALMMKQEYTDISISDITKMASVSRICFYRNFRSKDDILSMFISRVVSEIQQQVVSDPTHSLNNYFFISFNTIRNYSSVVRCIYNANLESLILRCFNEEFFRTPLACNGVRFDRYQLRFYTGAFYNVLIEWIMTGCRESVQEMSALCSSMVFPDNSENK